MNKLHVVTCISNPARYKSRYNLYREFEERVKKEPDAIHWTVEVAFDDRPHEVTDASNPHHLQLRSKHELWHKENMLNLMVQRIPDDGNPIAFVDADVNFQKPNWVKETLEALRHYQVVQMFSHSVDLTYNHELVEHEDLNILNQKGIIYQMLSGKKIFYWKGGDYGRRSLEHGGHPGYAWAWRREALDVVGGLIDFSILGSADTQMACGLVDDILKVVNDNFSENYRRQLAQWGERAKVLRGNVGYVPGLITHYWHGAKVQRGYNWRYKILVDSQFDPERDIRRDSKGLLQLVDDGSERARKLRDDLRMYFRSRNEDKID